MIFLISLTTSGRLFHWRMTWYKKNSISLDSRSWTGRLLCPVLVLAWSPWSVEWRLLLIVFRYLKTSIIYFLFPSKVKRWTPCWIRTFYCLILIIVVRICSLSRNPISFLIVKRSELNCMIPHEVSAVSNKMLILLPGSCIRSSPLWSREEYWLFSLADLQCFVCFISLIIATINF